MYNNDTIETAPQEIAAIYPLLDSSQDAVSLARLAIVPESSHCYITVRGSASHEVLEVDYVSGTLIAQHVTGQNPDRIVLAPSGDIAYTTNRDDGTLGMFHLDGQKRHALDVGGRPHGLALSPDGVYAFVGTLEGRVLKVDLAKQIVVAEQTFAGSSLADVLVRPNGHTVFAADWARSLMLVADSADIMTWRSIPTPAGPICLAFDPILQRLYCTCQEGKVLTIIAFTGSSSYAQPHHIDVVDLPTSGTPVGVDVSPNAERIFVCIKDPAGLGVYHVDSHTWYPVLALPENPINVRATVDSHDVLVTTKRCLIRIATRYGFGTHPDID